MIKVKSDPTVSLYSRTTDGCIWVRDSSYPTARTAQSGTVWSTTDPILGPVMTAGQNRNADGSYTIYRAALFFDTSTIPTNATINSASLWLTVAADHNMSAGWYLRVKQHTNNSEPLVSSDYYMYKYSGNGGQVYLSGYISTLSVVQIPLNSTGISWINKGGLTKLCLVSADDDDACAPSGLQSLMFYSSEAGTSHAPILTIDYSTQLTGQITNIKYYNPQTNNWDLTSPPTIQVGQLAGAGATYVNTGQSTLNAYVKYTMKRPDGSVKDTGQTSTFSMSPGAQYTHGMAWYTDNYPGNWTMTIELYGD